MSKDWKTRTHLVHGGTVRSHFGETSEALFLNSAFTYDSAEAAEARFKGGEPLFTYSRFSNPTVRMFEERMAAVDGVDDARATASGMAAVAASLFSLLDAGDHVISAKALFGSSLFIFNKLMERFGIDVTLVDGVDLDQWRAAMRPETKVLFLETPTNPAIEIIDITEVAGIAHAGGAKLIVDNVFATPLLQKPFELGADIVIYSATKHIDGQGRCLGGVILGDQKYIDDDLHDYLRHTGPALSPFNAWVLLKGLETLDVRVDRLCENAKAMADALDGHNAVKKILYPGRPDHPQADLAKKQMLSGGPMLALELKGGKRAAFDFSNALELMLISNNLGDAKTLITHPATTTHHSLSEEERQELGITGGLLRISAGLEDSEDLIADIARGLKAAG